MNWLEQPLDDGTGYEQQVVERYTQGLLAMARQQLPNQIRRRVDPEDVVQSVYRSFFRRLNNGEFKFDESYDVWRLLAVITYHKVHNVVKHHRRQRRDAFRDVSMDASDESTARQQFEGNVAGPDDLAIMLESLEMLLADLPDDYRQIVVMRLEGYSIAEIAERVQLSKRTVLRALSKLRDLASKQLETEA